MFRLEKLEEAELAHKNDLQFNLDILKKNKQLFPAMRHAFDIGAGMGRLTKDLLQPVFKKIDLLDCSRTQMMEAERLNPQVDERNGYCFCSSL